MDPLSGNAVLNGIPVEVAPRAAKRHRGEQHREPTRIGDRMNTTNTTTSNTGSTTTSGSTDRRVALIANTSFYIGPPLARELAKRGTT